MTSHFAFFPRVFFIFFHLFHRLEKPHNIPRKLGPKFGDAKAASYVTQRTRNTIFQRDNNMLAAFFRYLFISKSLYRSRLYFGAQSVAASWILIRRAARMKLSFYLLAIITIVKRLKRIPDEDFTRSDIKREHEPVRSSERIFVFAVDNINLSFSIRTISIKFDNGDCDSEFYESEFLRNFAATL